MGEMKAVATPSGVTLTWTPGVLTGNESPAASYNVLRSTTSGGENGTPIATVEAPIVTYLDTTGTPGETYFYEVVAVNSAGSSAPSNQVSATFLVPITIPPIPTNLTAVAS